MSDLRLASKGSFAPLLELVKGVKHCENLNSAHRREHVGVVARGGPETPAVVLAREHKVDGVGAREGLRVSQKVKRCEAPIQAVESEVLGKPVIVFVLASVETLNVLDVSRCREAELVGQIGEIRRHFIDYN